LEWNWNVANINQNICDCNCFWLVPCICVVLNMLVKQLAYSTIERNICLHACSLCWMVVWLTAVVQECTSKLNAPRKCDGAIMCWLCSDVTKTWSATVLNHVFISAGFPVKINTNTFHTQSKKICYHDVTFASISRSNDWTVIDQWFCILWFINFSI
jgi:hypothetical protein